jgi:hypothetical protein
LDKRITRSEPPCLMNDGCKTFFAEKAAMRCSDMVLVVLIDTNKVANQKPESVIIVAVF